MGAAKARGSSLLRNDVEAATLKSCVIADVWARAERESCDGLMCDDVMIGTIGDATMVTVDDVTTGGATRGTAIFEMIGLTTGATIVAIGDVTIGLAIVMIGD